MTSPARPVQIGGVIHTYQKYNPTEFPSPTSEQSDLVSTAFEYALAYGDVRQLTDEELARAVHIDPNEIGGLGASIDMLLAMLEERKRKILETYSSDGLVESANKQLEKNLKSTVPPSKFKLDFQKAVRSKQLYMLEQLWWRADDDDPNFAKQVLKTMETLANKYQMDELTSVYDFVGHQKLRIDQAIEVKKELEKIDELIKQLKEASKTAQIGLIDMQALAQFAPPADLNQLEELRQQINNYVREMAERQGLHRDDRGAFQLTPRAHKIFQSRLLERIFSKLEGSRTGRHTGRIVGDGSVELPSTKQYEFGDSIANLDTTQSVINAMLARPFDFPIRLRSEDLEVHRTRNNPKCATVVAMDMSGSMRYEGQYINVKRMGLALQGLISQEYPGDFLRFIQMYTFAKLCQPGEIIELMPHPVTIHNPVVRLKADMSQPDVSEYDIPPHFTNIQHALRLARQNLATVDTKNKQIVLITDGLPTAHFEDETLFLLYPPDLRTEQATMREAMLCARENIVINLFLVPSWSQSEEDIRFAHRMAEKTKGRVFFTGGNDLDRFVLWDYVERKREIVG
jgi:uncharacterized protein with von Willebrand factor type A (vWA) domain